MADKETSATPKPLSELRSKMGSGEETTRRRRYPSTDMRDETVDDKQKSTSEGEPKMGSDEKIRDVQTSLKKVELKMDSPGSSNKQKHDPEKRSPGAIPKPVRLSKQHVTNKETSATPKPLSELRSKMGSGEETKRRRRYPSTDMRDETVDDKQKSSSEVVPKIGSSEKVRDVQTSLKKEELKIGSPGSSNKQKHDPEKKSLGAIPKPVRVSKQNVTNSEKRSLGAIPKIRISKPSDSKVEMRATQTSPAKSDPVSTDTDSEVNVSASTSHPAGTSIGSINKNVVRTHKYTMFREPEKYKCKQNDCNFIAADMQTLIRHLFSHK